MTRKEMIAKLIDSDAKSIRTNAPWLESFLRAGYPGYDYLTDDELLAELGKRNLMAAEAA